jgi:hypothetical protein
VHGDFSGGDFAGLWQFREARTAYSEEIVVPRQDQPTVVGDGALIPENFIFRSYPEPTPHIDAFTGITNGILTSLQQGCKTFQFRCWMIEQDEGTDSNAALTTMGIEIEVHRTILFPDEEYFYAVDEMLDNQQRLLNRSTELHAFSGNPIGWRAIPSLQDLVAGPVIDDVPVRETNVISYTVSVVATVKPD